MNYGEFVTALAGLVVTPENNPKFLAILPRAIDYAEGRIFKDMDFLADNGVDNTTRDFIIGNREVVVPPDFVTVEEVGYISGGDTVYLYEVSLDFINQAYPSRNVTGQVKYWARKDYDRIVVAPAPPATNDVEFIGSVRPAAIASGNPTTYVSEHHPELLVAAAMVFMTGYQKNFGAQAEDPKMGLSWEGQYKTLLQSSLAEEARRRGAGPRS